MITYVYIQREYISERGVCENSSLNSPVCVYMHIYKYIVYIIYTLHTYIYHTCYFIPLVSKYIWIYVYAYMECMHMCIARKSCVIVWKNNCFSVQMHVYKNLCLVCMHRKRIVSVSFLKYIPISVGREVCVRRAGFLYIQHICVCLYTYMYLCRRREEYYVWKQLSNYTYVCVWCTE